MMISLCSNIKLCSLLTHQPGTIYHLHGTCGHTILLTCYIRKCPSHQVPFSKTARVNLHIHTVEQGSLYILQTNKWIFEQNYFSHVWWQQWKSRSLPDDLTAAVALRIISRRFTEREPKALVITLIDSSPKLLLLLFPSSMQNQTHTHIYIYIHTHIHIQTHLCLCI